MVDICIPRLTGLHGGIGAMVDPCQKRWMNLLRALSLLSGATVAPHTPSSSRHARLKKVYKSHKHACHLDLTPPGHHHYQLGRGMGQVLL